MRFGENNVKETQKQNILIYMNFKGYWEELHIPPHIFCLLFTNAEKYKSMTYTKIEFYISFFFPRINKKIPKRGAPGSPAPISL